MGCERRERVEQALVEAGRVGGVDGLERAKTNIARDDRREAPVVGAAKRAETRYAELVGVDPRDRRRSGESGLGHRAREICKELADASGIGNREQATRTRSDVAASRTSRL